MVASDYNTNYTVHITQSTLPPQRYNPIGNMTSFHRSTFRAKNAAEKLSSYWESQEQRSTVRQARRRNSHGIVELAKFKINESKFLGTNKSGEDYNTMIQASMARYMRKRDQRRNLLAIIMPAGHGKTTLAKKYGFIDVDMLVTLEEHNNLVEEREALLSGMDSWSRHNTRWFERINRTLDLLDFSRPTVILVHTEELALEIGAVPIGALRLAPAVFAHNIANRDTQGRFFSKRSYECWTTTPSCPNVLRNLNNATLESSLIEILNVCSVPVACPNKFGWYSWNNHYDRSVPKWVLTGEVDNFTRVDINFLRNLHETGRVPKECVDYFVRHGYVPTQFDYGVTMFEWSEELAHIPPVTNSRQRFDLLGDTMVTFPPKDAREITRANVTVRHLVQTFDIFNHTDALEIAERHVGEPQTFVAGILSAWKGIAQSTSVAHLVFPWFGINFNHWSKRMKNIHAYVRASKYLMNTEITEEDRQALMYMDLLVGRGTYDIDEDAEVALRHSDTYETKHLSYDQVRKCFTNEQYKVDFKRR